MKKISHALFAFSLIESAIVLAIVGLVIGGIWVGASVVNFNRNVNSLASDIATIAQNIRSKGNSSFWVGPVVSSGSTTTYLQNTLFSMKLIPSNWGMDASQTYLVDPYFGGYLSVQTGNGAIDSVRFALEYISDPSGIVLFPRSTCIAVANSLMQKFHSTLPKRATSPYSNMMVISGNSGATNLRAFDTAYDFLSMSGACPSDPLEIDLYVSF